MLEIYSTSKKPAHIYTKFHCIKSSIKLSYDSLQDNIFTKFHASSTDRPANVSFDKKPFSRLIESSATLYLQISQPSKSTLSLWVKIFKKRVFNYLDFQHDWTRGRFKGQVVNIVIWNGIVTKKTFITPQGRIINVDRSSLGIIYKLFNTITFLNQAFH